MRPCLALLVGYLCLAGYGQADLQGAAADSSTVASTVVSSYTTVISSSMALPTSAPETSKVVVVTSEATTAAASTVAPVTSTAAPPTTPMPPPTPDPTSGNWSVFNPKTNKTCILIVAGIQVQLNLHDTSTGENVSRSVNVPPNGIQSNQSHASGACNDNDAEQSIAITFDDWVLSVVFRMNATSAKYDLYNVSLTYNTANRFPWAEMINETVSQPKERFDTDSKKRFECLAKQAIYKQDVKNGVTEIDTFALKFQAFRNVSSQDFEGNGLNRCVDDEVSQLVPIIVGAALGGLIVIVLIAYLIGRKRSRRGYESV